MESPVGALRAPWTDSRRIGPLYGTHPGCIWPAATPAHPASPCSRPPHWRFSPSAVAFWKKRPQYRAVGALCHHLYEVLMGDAAVTADRKSTRLNSSHL